MTTSGWYPRQHSIPHFFKYMRILINKILFLIPWDVLRGSYFISVRMFFIKKFNYLKKLEKIQNNIKD